MVSSGGGQAACVGRVHLAPYKQHVLSWLYSETNATQCVKVSGQGIQPEEANHKMNAVIRVVVHRLPITRLSVL